VRERSQPPIVSIVGASGAGKTTLLEQLIPWLVQRGLRVGTVKHDVHGFEMDRPGKDSWRHKKAGSVVAVISSPMQIGMVMDVDHDHDLDELAKLLPPVDVVLTEGYKKDNHPKLEVFRSEIHPEPLCKGDHHLLALVSDAPVDLGVPCFSTNDVGAVAEFIIASFQLHPASAHKQRQSASKIAP
jgi:molybdopterin-guanine dinucleotide biosynthesis protein B